MSSYPQLEDLMIVSDILISDYSSIFFDYSIMEKPMFCYAYDYDKYNIERGLYFDIRKELKSTEDEDQLISMIKTLNKEEMVEKTRRFKEKFVDKYGNATQSALDIIYEAINLYD